MTATSAHLSDRRLRTPRAAAIAGILFALLMGTSNTLIRISVPPDSYLTSEWLAEWAGTVTFALSLLPFAGIAFLWLMGVLRDRLGHLEDQFFSTLFFGSGFLYLGMTFSTAVVIGSLLTIYRLYPDLLDEPALYIFARTVSYRIHTVYAIRMAGMFMFVLGTIWVRTKVMPRWLALMTFALALLLVLGIAVNQWVIMVFPAWVLLISAYILILTYRFQGDNATEKGSPMSRG